MTPDENPFIDKHPNYANIIMASGFSGKIMVKTLHLPVHVLFCARQLCCCTPFAIMKVYIISYIIIKFVVLVLLQQLQLV